MKKMLKTLANIFIFISIFLTLEFIHELGHCLVGLIGCEVHELGFNYVKISCDSLEKAMLGLVFGSLTAGLVALILLLIAYKKNLFTIYVSTFSVILGELFYWGISYFIKDGDGFRFIKLLESDGRLFSTSFLVLFVYLCIIFIEGCIKIGEKQNGF